MHPEVAVRVDDREAPPPERVPDPRQRGPVAGRGRRASDRRSRRGRRRGAGASECSRARRRRRGRTRSPRTRGASSGRRRRTEDSGKVPSSIHAKISARSVGERPAPPPTKETEASGDDRRDARNAANRREPQRGSSSLPRLQKSSSPNRTPPIETLTTAYVTSRQTCPANGTGREDEPRRHDRPRERQEVARRDEDEDGRASRAGCGASPGARRSASRSGRRRCISPLTF